MIIIIPILKIKKWGLEKLSNLPWGRTWILCLQSHKFSHLTHLEKALNISAIWSVDHLSTYVFQKIFAAYSLCHSYLLSSSPSQPQKATHEF